MGKIKTGQITLNIYNRFLITVKRSEEKMAVYKREPSKEEYDEFFVLSLLSEAGQVYVAYVAEVEPYHQYSVYKKGELDDIMVAYKVEDKEAESFKLYKKVLEVRKEQKRALKIYITDF